MAKKVTAETRAAAFEAIRSGMALLEVVEKFGVPAELVLELAALNAKGSKPRSEGGGRKQKVTADAAEKLRAYVLANPAAHMGSLIAFLEPLVGERLSSPTVAAALQRLGFERKRRPGLHVPAEPKPAADRRFGAQHRREPTATTLPSDMTDQEWATIEPLLPAKRDGRGRPPTHTRRELMNAIFYIARTGCQWRAVPHCYPHWQAVWSLFRRLRNAEWFAEAFDKEREQWRAGRGKPAAPSLTIVDSQSVKTTEKGGLADTTRARKPRVASIIWLWTATDCRSA